MLDTKSGAGMYRGLDADGRLLPTQELQRSIIAHYVTQGCAFTPPSWWNNNPVTTVKGFATDSAPSRFRARSFSRSGSLDGAPAESRGNRLHRLLKELVSILCGETGANDDEMIGHYAARKQRETARRVGRRGAEGDELLSTEMGSDPDEERGKRFGEGAAEGALGAIGGPVGELAFDDPGSIATGIVQGAAELQELAGEGTFGVLNAAEGSAAEHSAGQDSKKLPRGFYAGGWADDPNQTDAVDGRRNGNRALAAAASRRLTGDFSKQDTAITQRDADTLAGFPVDSNRRGAAYSALQARCDAKLRGED